MGRVLWVVVVFTGTEQYFKKESVAKSAVFIASTLVSAAILMFYYICSSDLILNSRRFPEKFKVRPTGTAKAGWSWVKVGWRKRQMVYVLDLRYKLYQSIPLFHITMPTVVYYC